MIHNTCPCCEVARLPHRSGCTFHGDAPSDAEDFDYVSALRDEITRLTAERDAAIRERDAARAECERLRVAQVKAAQERDRAHEARRRIRIEWEERGKMLHRAYNNIGQCRARVAALESAAAANAGGEQQPEAWGVRWHGQPKIDFDFVYEHEESAADIATDDGNNGTVVPLYAAPQPPRGWLTAEERDAAIRERDAAQSQCEELERAALADHQTIGTLRARVAELEGAAKLAPDRNAGGGSNHPVAWLHEELEYCFLYPNDELKSKCVPLYAAPQPPRGWLTEEERALIEYLRATFEQNADAWRPHGLGGHVDNQDRRVRLLDALLARETPPMVKVPPGIISALPHEREQQWIAAIRAAGWEVEG